MPPVDLKARLEALDRYSVLIYEYPNKRAAEVVEWADLAALLVGEEPPADQVTQALADAAEIRSSYGFVMMRVAVAKDADDAYDVLKREWAEHEAAFRRLETSLPKLLAASPRVGAPTEEQPASLTRFLASVDRLEKVARGERVGAEPSPETQTRTKVCKTSGTSECTCPPNGICNDCTVPVDQW